MKKILLILAVVMTAFSANAKEYTEDLVVTINGESTSPTPTTVAVEENEDGTINFELKNFILASDGEEMPVGNIRIENLTTTTEDGVSSFAFNGNITITEGDIEGAEMWLGPMLGELPLNMTGKMNDTRLYVNIDLDLSETLGSIINVKLGKEEEVETGIMEVKANADVNANANFNIAGQRVNGAKGLVIENGKKVIK